MNVEPFVNIRLFPLYDPLAMLGAPWQWALVALLAVLLFAPHLLPSMARMAGRLFGMELRRRAGLPPRERRKPGVESAEANAETQRRRDAEDLPRRHDGREEDSGFGIQDSGGNADTHDSRLTTHDSVPRAPRLTLLLVGLAALAAVGALFWVLLHAR